MTDEKLELGELEFKAEDFRLKRSYHDETWDYEHILLTLAQTANALLRERLAKAPRVYGLYALYGHSWQDVKCSPQTHEARLVCVRKLGDG